MIDLLNELAANYDVNGISLDLTRWCPPPNPKRHDVSVLTNFIKEIREALKMVSRTRGEKVGPERTRLLTDVTGPV